MYFYIVNMDCLFGGIFNSGFRVIEDCQDCLFPILIEIPDNLLLAELNKESAMMPPRGL